MDVQIVNIKGEVIDVIESSFKVSGEHSISWNAQNFASGVYFMNISKGNQVITQKLIVVVFCSSIFFQTFGFSKILIENNYLKK